MITNDFLKLILITQKNQQPLTNYLDFIALCAQGGITSVQLREKQLSHDELYFFGKKLKNILDKCEIPLIINDHVELCIAINAAGVHLGQQDGDVYQARHRLGHQKIIGLSINHFQQLAHANTLPINYVGVGAIFPTKNKADIENFWGLSGLKEAASISTHPIVAIGGIEISHIENLINYGAKGIAGISIFHNTPCALMTTQYLRKKMEC